MYGDVEWDREETHQFYVNRTTDQSRRDDLLDPRWALDTIDPALVGCIDLAAVENVRRNHLGPWGVAIQALRGVVNIPLQAKWRDAVRDANLWMSGQSVFGAGSKRS